MSYEEEEELRPTEDSAAYRGRYSPAEFGGLTGPEHFSSAYSGSIDHDWIDELKHEEDNALKEELEEFMRGTSELKVANDLTEEEFITYFRNNYRRKREEGQHGEGFYG